jgi:methylglutaconyl-CoA hydratase
MGEPVIVTRRHGPIEYLTLNRPDVRNAFDDRLVAELTAWADRMAGDAHTRVVVLAGRGPVFCAGADLGWMARSATLSPAENRRDAEAAAGLFAALDRLPQALVARVHGAALGGGAGLVAVSDIAVAADTARFAFSEVKLGIVPAVISPYVVARIGVSAARALFLTGMRFPASRAREIGLVDAVVPEAELDTAVDRYVQELLGAAPGAVADAKRLIAAVAGRPPADVRRMTVELLATRRESDEGREGMRAFLDKRSPGWHVPPDSDR